MHLVFLQFKGFVSPITHCSRPGAVAHFIALPAAFSAMPLGTLFGGLFFVFLAFAALTSAVSLLEVPVSYGMERFYWSTIKAVCIVIIILFVLGIPSLLSLGNVSGLTFGGKSFFDWVDFITSHIMLPIGAISLLIMMNNRDGSP
ncbi:hypothetical protein [Paenibacillus sp. J2TS4]|uniref:hypothetical protein n=1 Tax=Paenibacillus sp. J2TS4 TaxID=2807194 RepID=UPI001B23E3D1|nr:hypothetical protein [Paenibacillus sp. J2TS4]GIP34791.1 hypothetical protein J2TS4_40010 [Paenibacillus sp. J2TS4]